MALNKNRISITLENKRAIGTRGKHAIFTTNGRSSLYTLDMQAIVMATEANPQDISAMEEKDNNLKEKEKQEKVYKDAIEQDIKENTFELWHCHLRHSNPKYIMKMKETTTTGILFPKCEVSVGERVCEACLAGKMKESFYKKIDVRIFK